MPEPGEVSMDEFKLMVDRAGLGMDQQEIEELKADLRTICGLCG